MQNFPYEFPLLWAGYELVTLMNTEGEAKTSVWAGSKQNIGKNHIKILLLVQVFIGSGKNIESWFFCLFVFIFVFVFLRDAASKLKYFLCVFVR